VHSKDEARGNSRRSSHPEGQSPTRVKATSPTRRQSSGSLFYANLVEVPLASAACCARDATHAVTDAVKDAPVARNKGRYVLPTRGGSCSVKWQWRCSTPHVTCTRHLRPHATTRARVTRACHMFSCVPDRLHLPEPRCVCFSYGGAQRTAEIVAAAESCRSGRRW
jgi:hypothetical protein